MLKKKIEKQRKENRFCILEKTCHFESRIKSYLKFILHLLLLCDSYILIMNQFIFFLQLLKIIHVKYSSSFSNERKNLGNLKML